MLSRNSDNKSTDELLQLYPCTARSQRCHFWGLRRTFVRTSTSGWFLICRRLYCSLWLSSYVDRAGSVWEKKSVRTGNTGGLLLWNRAINPLGKLYERHRHSQWAVVCTKKNAFVCSVAVGIRGILCVNQSPVSLGEHSTESGTLGIHSLIG